MGMIGILKIGEDQYRFATYNNSKLVYAVFEDNKLVLELKRQNIVLKLEAELKDGRVLKAPKKGIMIDSIKETLEGKVNVELYEDGDLVYKGESESAGIERVSLNQLIKERLPISQYSLVSSNGCRQFRLLYFRFTRLAATLIII